MTQHGELELLIAPSGVLPVISFLTEHHNGQFSSLADIAGMDVPGRENRFEVRVVFPREKFVNTFRKSDCYPSLLYRIFVSP